MKQKVLKYTRPIMLVALDDLKKGETVSYGNDDVVLSDDVVLADDVKAKQPQGGFKKHDDFIPWKRGISL